MTVSLLLYIIVIAIGLLAFIYYSTTKEEPFAKKKKVRFDDQIDVRTFKPESLNQCSLSALNDDSDACLDDDLVDAETKRAFTRKLIQDHEDYMQATDAFFKYVTNEDAVIKIEPSVDPFKHPEHYYGQTLDSIYEQQLTKYKAR